jgi:hypothetical protein
VIATLSTLIVGLLVSWLTGGTESPTRPTGARLLGHAAIYTARVTAAHSGSQHNKVGFAPLLPRPAQQVEPAAAV